MLLAQLKWNFTEIHVPHAFLADFEIRRELPQNTFLILSRILCSLFFPETSHPVREKRDFPLLCVNSDKCDCRTCSLFSLPSAQYFESLYRMVVFLLFWIASATAHRHLLSEQLILDEESGRTAKYEFRVDSRMFLIQRDSKLFSQARKNEDGLR